MKYTTQTYDTATVRVASFTGGGTRESHAIARVTDPVLTFEEQLCALISAFRAAPVEGVPVFARLFVSDAANQLPFCQIARDALACPLSVVEQPPLDGSKAALWVWTMERSAYKHRFTTDIPAPSGDSCQQTLQLLGDYAAHTSLSHQCVRTWFFVNDIDNNYAGVVRGRNDIFEREGLNDHFIASTGIGGRHADHRVSVLMDAYAVEGLQEGQLTYLYAPTHLNPTRQYGVAFERGAAIDYGDRRHVFISGTASIDNRGQIVHPCDIRRQTDRMVENVRALLSEADCHWCDVPHIIVYLRDIADRQVVEDYFNTRFPDIPRVLTAARVCRPGWLIEMECMAVRPAHNPRYAPL